MDSREAPPPPQPPQPPQQQQQPNLMVRPNSYPSPNNNNNNSNNNNSGAAAMIEPNTIRYQFNPVSQKQQPTSKPMDAALSPSPFDGSLRSCGSGGFSIDSSNTVAASAGKKKRGRPRKYSPDGNIALGLAPTSQIPPPPSIAAPPSAAAGEASATMSSDPPAKKNRGRPPGSGKKQLDALGAGGVGFTPHVIMVQQGEDIAQKVMTFSQQGPRTVCILSATGPIGNVTLRQPSMSGGTVTFEGRFEIISLAGSYLFSESNGNRSRTGGLSVSLAGSDGQVLGGGVCGVLLAAGPVQVIVGSFIAEGKKSSSSLQKSGPSSPPPTQMLNFGAPMIAASPSSQGGGSTESSDENGSSPLNRGPVLYSNPSQPTIIWGYTNYGQGKLNNEEDALQLL